MLNNKTRHMPTQRSTAFWKTLGVDVRRRKKALKTYKPKQDMAALRRSGVNQNSIDKVYDLCQTYQDELLFKKFSRFFRKDVETVKTWTKTTTASGAFKRLFNIYHKNDLTVARGKLSELFLIFQYYRKGEAQIFSGKITSGVNINSFTTTNLRRRLTYSSKTAEYRDKGSTQFDNGRILWIQRNTDGKKTDKFIKLSKVGNKLFVALSFDSKNEYYVTKNEVEKYFDTFLETPQSVKDLKRFNKFLRTGISKHFILSGVSYYDAEFRISISPSYNRTENVTELPIYTTKIAPDHNKLAFVTQLRLSYKSKRLNKPIFISILTYREGIFGAILLKFDDKKLTSVQRKGVYNDFKEDFGVPLNEFVSHNDLASKEIYRLLLEVPSRISKIELRSDTALSIYSSLILSGLLTSNIVEEVSKLCINSTCSEYFKPVWGIKKYCSVCSEMLINGRSIEVRIFEEKAIADYLRNSITIGTVSCSVKTVLSRKIVVCQTEIGDEIIDFIPIVKPLNDNQLTLIKFRYPHAVLITTRSDKNDLISRGFRACTLWELAYSVQEDKGKIVSDFARKARAQSLSSIRTLCANSVIRVNDENYYKDRNNETRNLGAELFEADCSILFDYIFGNCIWLGAKYRGKSLPDGFTAFPMLRTSSGCFIWDTKFSEGKTLHMGNFSKNKHYIQEASKNSSIVDNGGLKGFVFVSNNIFPPKFVKKYSPLTKGKRLKVSFIRAVHIQKITEHYQYYETLILRNIRARKQFSDSMVDLFFTTTSGRRCEIITDEMVENHIQRNIKYFGKLKAGRALSA